MLQLLWLDLCLGAVGHNGEWMVTTATGAAQTAAAETAAAVKNDLSKTFRENGSHVMANLSTVGYVHCPAANVLSIWLVA